jgi:hypothetical protein
VPLKEAKRLLAGLILLPKIYLTEVDYGYKLF